LERSAWLFDIGATYHITFQRDFFEEFNDNVDGIVYFANKSSLKPLGIGTFKVKLPGLLNFIMHDLSLMHIRQQIHSIHIFGG
jgi:hypothetical protein